MKIYGALNFFHRAQTRFILLKPQNEEAVPALTNQTRRRFGRRQPLCGIGVTSRMTTICNPAAAKSRTADSRPRPGPCTRTSQLFMLYSSRALPAAVRDACFAAYCL